MGSARVWPRRAARRCSRAAAPRAASGFRPKPRPATASPKNPRETVRLTRRRQFLFVREGAKARRPTLIVEARRRAESGAIGIGFTASRKVGGAVARNRARRRLKEAARKLLGEHGLAGVDYVVVARPNTPDAAWAALLDDLGNALIRLRAELALGATPRPTKRAVRASESD